MSLLFLLTYQFGSPACVQQGFSKQFYSFIVSLFPVETKHNFFTFFQLVNNNVNIFHYV